MRAVLQLVLKPLRLSFSPFLSVSLYLRLSVCLSLSLSYLEIYKRVRGLCSGARILARCLLLSR